MTIAAKYEDGVFKPLEEVKLTEGTRVEVHVAEQPRRRPISVREFAACGPTARTSPTVSGTLTACGNPRFNRSWLPMAYLIETPMPPIACSRRSRRSN